jgi:predicted GNAT family acetyltransferase
MEQEIKNDSKSGQFILDSNGKESFLKYKITDHSIDLYSTYVPEELRGQKLGDKLVEYSLEFAREHQLKIIPSCPFIRKYFSKHPEYGHMLSN